MTYMPSFNSYLIAVSADKGSLERKEMEIGGRVRVRGERKGQQKERSYLPGNCLF